MAEYCCRRRRQGLAVRNSLTDYNFLPSRQQQAGKIIATVKRSNPIQSCQRHKMPLNIVYT